MTTFDLVLARQDRHAARVNTDAGPLACWSWTGNRSKTGYGVMSLGKAKVIRAHRAAWMLHHRQPIPDGMVVCHSCDNPNCVTPAHLWLGTVADNNHDRAVKGRSGHAQRDEASVAHKRGTSHPASKFTEDQVLSIRRDARSLSQLAAIYGVNQATISKIKSGRTYALIAQQAKP